MKLLITTKVTSYARPNPFQIAASLYDIEGRALQRVALTIKPDGWEIPADAAARSGIDTRMAAQIGVPIRPAMILVKALTELSDEWFAFNTKLTDQSLQLGMENAGSSNSWMTRTMKANCIMRAGSPLVGAKDSEGMDRDSSLASMAEALLLTTTNGTLYEDFLAAEALMGHLLKIKAFA